jgi:tripartite-type tricarboxylate transporter receptor subunit TctC
MQLQPCLRCESSDEHSMRIAKWFSHLMPILFFFFLAAPVSPQANFYEGKTITLIQSSDPGGTADMRIRSMMAFLAKYIPGNPNISTEYMAGAGGRKAANHIYRARPDGLTILSATSGLIPSAIMGETGVLYDIDKLIYLGTPYSEFHAVFFTRKVLGLDTIDKLRAASGLRVGAQSVGHATYREGRVFSYLLGLTRPTFVVGFSGPEIDLAMERGEVDGRSSATESVLQRNPARLEKGSVHFHSIFEAPQGNKHPRFGHIPEIEIFAKSDKERKLMALVRNLKSTGAPLVLPPGTHEERVQILRQAFRRMFKDPAFHEDFKKRVSEEPSPLTAEALEVMIKETPRNPEAIELLKSLNGPGPLPPR